MAKFNIKTVKPKFVVTTNPENKIEVVVNKPILTSKVSKSFFKLKNTGGPRGEKGDPGENATVEVLSTTTGAPGTDASVVNEGTPSNAQLAFTIPRGDKGDTGLPGSDGFSPSASVAKSGDTATITITDKECTTTASVSDGRDGTDGTDGFSPIAAVSKSGDTATITITDKEGTTTASVSDGTDGADGFSPIASVSKSGDTATITITDKEGTTTASISDGTDGQDGAAATIAVGTTTTLNPGESATVTNSGTSSAAVFDFGIPKGAKGDTGTAATITVGSTTTGNPGTNASVTNSGTSSAAILDFTIPRGAKGDTGATGASGAAATIAVGTTTTGDAGTNASVTNSGTSSAAVFDFTIPKGAKGDPGATGTAATIAVGTVTTGQPGTDATVTNSGTSSAAVFNFTIPRGDKGEAGSGSGDMLAADYDPNGTVASAGGIVDYVGGVLPTNFTGATSSVAGTSGLVPAPTTSDPDNFLKGDGTWATPPGTTYTAGTNIQISAQNVISATDTTYSDFTGATSSVAGAHGLVPAPAAGDNTKVLKGDGTWGEKSEKFVIMKYGESSAWAKFIAAYNENAIVYCRASSNTNPATGAQTRMAFMAYVSDETTPTSVEFQYVRSVSTKTSSQPVDQVFVYRLTNANGGTWSVETRNMAAKLAAGTNTSVSYSSGTYTVSATDTTYSDFTGATSGAAGAHGLVPQPAAGDDVKYLKGDGSWATIPAANNINSTDWDALWQ